MPNLDAVLAVHERHHPVPQLLARRRRRDGLARREQVLEDLDDPLPERRGEALEHEVRVRLADGAARRGGQVVPQQDVVQREGGRRPVRQVRDRQRRRRAAVLVQEDDVRQPRRVRGADQVRQHQVAAVEPHGRGEQQPDLFGEGAQSGGGRARRRDQHAGVDDAGEVGVFVVEGKGGRVGGLGFVVFVVCAQRRVVGDGGEEGLAAGEGGFEGGALGGDLGVAEGEGAAVEVVASLAGLSADHGGGVALGVVRMEGEWRFGTLSVGLLGDGFGWGGVERS